ncbi:MAG: winged helix-turn-helix transcriptional regulator [Pseudonocardiaceae bacterium]
MARSSELLAKRWTPIIVRNLLKRLSHLQRDPAGGPASRRRLLAQRLEALERHGLLVRTVNPSGRRGCRIRVDPADETGSFPGGRRAAGAALT